MFALLYNDMRATRCVFLCPQVMTQIGEPACHCNFYYTWADGISYIHTRQPTNPRPMPTNFYGLVGYDRVKNYPLWLKSVSIPDQRPLYPRWIPDAPTLKSRSSRPTTVLPTDKSPFWTTNPRPIPDTTTLTTLNIGPTPDLISTPGLKLIIQANVRA